MLKNISFSITKEKERELFNYITYTCQYNILVARTDDLSKTVYDSNFEIGTTQYFITSKDYKAKYNYEEIETGEKKYCLEIGMPASMVTYTRVDIDEEEKSFEYDFFAELFMLNGLIFPKDNTTKDIFDSIQKWIKNNGKIVKDKKANYKYYQVK